MSTPANQPLLDAAADGARRLVDETYYTGCRVRSDSILVAISGLAAVLALAGCGGSGVAANAAAKCLGGHGWQVEHISAKEVVARRDATAGVPYTLTYRPGAKPVVGLTGWTGYVPLSKSGWAGGQLPLPGCFRRFLR